jgi:hypothetical protein
LYIESHVARPEQPFPHAVRIEVEKTHYQPGEAIDGRVVVVPAFDDVCESLAIELQLYAHGWLSSVGVAAEQRLYAGPLRAGVAAAFPFRIAAPRTAGPYRGHLLNLELRLAAVMLVRREERDLVRTLTGISRKEMAARAYPAAAQAITVVPDSRPLEVSADPEKVRRVLADRGIKVFAGCLLMVMGVAALVVGVMMWLGIIPVDEIVAQIGTAAGGLLFGLLASVLLFQNLGVWMAQKKIGTPDIRVTTQASIIDVSVRLPNPVTVNSVHASIRAVESMSRSLGSSTEIREHILAEQVFELGRGAQPGLFGAQLPASALAAFPPTVGLPSARIVWRLALRIALPLWSDWQEEVPLDAYPGGDRSRIPVQYILTFD